MRLSKKTTGLLLAAGEKHSIIIKKGQQRGAKIFHLDASLLFVPSFSSRYAHPLSSLCTAHRIRLFSCTCTAYAPTFVFGKLRCPTCVYCNSFVYFLFFFFFSFFGRQYMHPGFSSEAVA
uniref:Uncharacterized protein n=1 Tax=Trypanosoma congolense (strain IL3000) TaxID=1068625 RepID=G0UU61_TRYCI|nr:hypothetical protein, unlikely [Trypanosoma congolense IL3000]